MGQDSQIKNSDIIETTNDIMLRLSTIQSYLEDDSATVTAIAAIQSEIDDILARALVVLAPLSDNRSTPRPTAAVVEDAEPTECVINFSTDIAITDETGFTVSGSTLATAVSGVAVSGNELTVTFDDEVANGEVPVVAYDGATGNLESAAVVAIIAPSFTITPVNNVE